MKFIIPTYKRSETISKKTLKVLKNGGVPKDDIWLFIVKEEVDAYRKNVSNDLYGHLVVGELGIVNQRNFITHFFEEGDCLVEVDDDLETFERLPVETDPSGIMVKPFCVNGLISVENIPKFCENAFEVCRKEKCGLWGIHPCHNAYFLKEKTTTYLLFLSGIFTGRFNRKSIILSIEEKDDFERTCKFYLDDDKVVRFWNVCCKTKYYNPKGGKGEEKLDRKAESLVAAKKLVELFPHLCKLYLKKKSGYAEVRLKDRRVKKPGIVKTKLPPTNIFTGTWEEDCDVMENVLKKLKWANDRTHMMYVPKGNGSMVYGVTWRSNYNNKVREPHPTLYNQFWTVFRTKNPQLNPIFIEFRDKYFPDFEYTNVQLNKNYPCIPHFDSKNTGVSTLIAFGDYKDGETCLYNREKNKIEKFDARLKPIIFDGSKILHWVAPIRRYGDRYSLVYFNRETNPTITKKKEQSNLNT